jgi:hypothetical protein
MINLNHKLLILFVMLSGCVSNEAAIAEKLNHLHDKCSKLAAKLGVAPSISYTNDRPNPSECRLKTDHGEYSVGGIVQVESSLNILKTKGLIDTYDDRKACEKSCIKDHITKYPDTSEQSIKTPCMFECLDKFGVEF